MSKQKHRTKNLRDKAESFTRSRDRIDYLASTIEVTCKLCNGEGWVEDCYGCDGKGTVRIPIPQDCFTPAPTPQ